MATIKKDKNIVVKSKPKKVVATDKTSIRKPVLKKQELAQKPTYENLKLGVSLDEDSAPFRGSKVATKQDSLDYVSGFKKGINRKKDPMENTVSRMGRYEGQNTPKKYIGGSKSLIKTKAKNGKSFPDLNKDGKITKADILKGRGVIAKKGAAVKKAKSGTSMKKCRGGCK